MKTLLFRMIFTIPLLLFTAPLLAQDEAACTAVAQTATELYDRGVACYEIGQHERAIEDFSRALEIEPDNTQICIWRAFMYRVIGAYDLAAVDYSTLIERNPDNVDFLSDRGHCYQQQGLYQQAITDFSRALEIDPYRAVVFSDRAASYYALDDYAAALADLTQAINLGIESPASAYQRRGQIYFDQGEYEQALVEFSQAIGLEPHNGYYYNWRGLTRRNLDDYEAALADFDKAIIYNERHDSWAFSSRGWLHMALGNHDQALEDYAQAIVLDPLNDDAYRYRAEALLDMEDYQGALADALKFVELAPDNAYGYWLVGRAYDLLGQYDDALTAYRQYLELTGDRADPAVMQRVRELENPSADAPDVSSAEPPMAFTKFALILLIALGVLFLQMAITRYRAGETFAEKPKRKGKPKRKDKRDEADSWDALKNDSPIEPL